MNDITTHCLALPRADREKLMDILAKSLNTNERLSLDAIHNAVVKVCGIEIVTTSRQREQYIGRVIFSFIACNEGYSETTIGEYIKRNHSSVNLMKNEFKCWNQLPKLYKAELKLYEKIREELNNEIER